MIYFPQEVNMSKNVIELQNNYKELLKEKADLEKRYNKVTKKQLEIITSINKQQKKHNNLRISALICSLLTPTFSYLIPFFGVWFAIIPGTLLLTTIIQAIRMFITEDKIDKLKKDINTCNSLMDIYSQDADRLTEKIDEHYKDLDNYSMELQTNLSTINQRNDSFIQSEETQINL